MGKSSNCGVAVALTGGDTLHRMRLLNADLAIIRRAKITEYLLNPEHLDNGGKTAFFVAREFSRSDWETFADAPRRLALAAEVTESMETVHGKKYIVDGELENPAGKAAWVRSIWIIDAGTDLPRLVTAYPLGR